MTGLYLHFPFCAKKCPYCDFFSVSYRRETAERYVGAVLRDLAFYQVEDTVDSVYFGGGTPSLLSAAQVGRILDTVARRMHLDDHAEITLEYDPVGRRSAYLRDLRTAGVTRLSIGTQSFSDETLRLLGRRHTAADGRRTVEDAAAAGFREISCDLMLAVPDQTQARLAETLDVLTQLPITHVSAYLLQVEPGTPLSKDDALLARCPDADESADRYLQAVRTLEAAGLRQYEVSSFARPGSESVHNLKYWTCVPYLGIGAGAHSCFGGRRFCIPKDLPAYLAAETPPEVTLDDAPCGTEERLMLALRLTRGVPQDDLPAGGRRTLPALLRAGYVRQHADGRVSLTPEGFAVSNAVIAALLET